MTHFEFSDSIPVAGQWLKGGGARLDVFNPYTQDKILSVTTASVDDVDAACSASKSAQLKWAALPPAARAEVMTKAASIIADNQDEIADWITREIGGTRVKAALECALVQGVFKSAAAMPYMVEGSILPEDIPGKESRAYKQPVGVVALISPWNFPLQLSARTLAPALAVGNGVVIKPASDSPVTGGLIFARILEEAGAPAGLVSVVPGSGKEIGDALIKHAIPRVISFTGSTPVGRGIAAAAAEGEMLKQLELELGGNSPIVVLDDADLDQAVEAAVWGKFMHSGQICMIANRIIVADAIYDAFVEKFVARTKALKVGDPSDPDTFIGPLINKSQFDGVNELIAKAKAEGAKVALEGDPEGLVIPPHIFTDVKPDSVLLTREIFGPVLAIQRAKDDEEALRFANDTEYGLSSAVFTQNVDRGLAFAKRVEAGMTHINDQPVNDSPFAPFGGEKNSGVGRFYGRWAIDAFTTTHWITIQHEKRAYPFSLTDMQG